MKSILAKILGLSLKSKVIIASIGVTAIAGTAGGTIYYNNEVSKQNQIATANKIKNASIVAQKNTEKPVETQPQTTTAEDTNKPTESTQSNTTPSSNTSTATQSNTTSVSKPTESTQSNTTSASKPSTTTQSNTTSASKPSTTTQSSNTNSVSAYYVAPPSCSSTTYNSALTNKLWSLKKEDSYNGVKASTFDEALKKYGCGDNNAINNACGYFTNPKIPTPLYKCEWNEYGYGLSCDGGDIQVSKFETSSNDAKEVLNQINNSGFYKPFSQASFESYFYRRVFICYNPSTKKNVVVRLGIGISKCAQQY